MLFGALFICGICAAGCGGTDSVSEQAAQGAAGDKEQQESSFGDLKVFTADTLGNGTFTQEDLMEKDVTVINFWSLLCGPCIEEMPDIAAFERALPDNVQILTACLDGREAQEEVEAVLEEAGFEGTTLLDGDGDYQELCGMIQYTPTTVFIDKEGNMVGDFMIGGQEDLAASYGEAINDVLELSGKEGMDLGT